MPTVAPASKAVAARTQSPVRTVIPVSSVATKSSAALTNTTPALTLAPGKPLAPTLRRRLEQSFGADLSKVQIQSNPAAAKSLGTKAFALGKRIVLGSGARPDDLALIAHEVAHTIQQSGGAQPQRYSESASTSLEGEAHQASAAASRGDRFSVTGRTTAATPQGLFGIDSPLDFLANKANLIPGFRMFTILLGVNPINMSSVERSAANVLRALIEFIPGGGLITEALDNNHVFEKVGQWVNDQVQSLGLSAAGIKKSVTDFISSLGASDLLDLSGAWERAKRIFTEPIERIITFAKSLASGILKFIKDAILIPIAKLAEGTPGYDLLKGVMGKDPITDAPVERTAENLVGPFMKLIGQEEIWENMKKANAIPRAWAWFQAALAELKAFVAQIPALFVAAFISLELVDIILVPRAFAKLVGVFGGFLARFTTWAGKAVWNLLELIFEVVAPGAMPYLKKVGGAIKSIFKNPIPFVGNLVKAGKLGFEKFAANIGTHLKNSMIEWLTGSLPGVYIPKALEIKEILKLVLSVLGLTWTNIRQKLVKAIGETAVKALEIGFDLVKTLITEGPAAAWEHIKDMLSDLKDTVMKGIIDFVVNTLVKKAVIKVVSLLIPGAAFIQAIITIYDTIMVFVDKLKKIIQVVTAFLDSMMAIASGVIEGAAAKIEGTLAGLLTLAISFLAGFAGLGKVADKVLEIIKKIRAPVDKALDKLIDIIVKLGSKIFGAVKAGAKKLFEWWKKKLVIKGDTETHTLAFTGDEETAELTLASTPQRVESWVATARVTRTTPKQVTILNNIDAQVPAIRTARQQLRVLKKANAAESAFKPHIDAIDKGFGVVGGYMGDLFSGENFGTTAQPVKLDWPKPAWNKYKPLFLYRMAPGWKITKTESKTQKFVKKYLPSGSHQNGDTSSGPPPAELDKLGISPIYQVAPNFLVGPLSDATTPGGAKINNLLAKYGWSAEGEGMDGDHVKEIQLGGKDEIPNLWPLDASINRGAGSTLSRSKVQLGPESLTVDLMKKVKLTTPDKNKGKFSFIINKVTG